ncbi:MAG: hypothetical protein A3H29_16795 [Acidobacteria bacterium RIFCSPLOWO2_02_FULL_67_21]|nr:MAG: hypothetical protein A3H29_16795 [Acidobacteria bacterium RIFCSPLOWO2_02_FULL_67_21]
MVLAPIDFSDPSRTALDVAARLARHTGAALHVLHAEDPLMAEAARQGGIDLRADTEEELGRFIASTPSAAALAPAKHVAIGPPVDVILSAARTLGADLIVVGSHGMSGAERLVFGSTTEGILRNAGVSVLVTPSAWAAAGAGGDLTGAGPLIAAVDFSPASLAAARSACALAAALGTTTELVHVVPELPVLARWSAHAAAAVREGVETARAELARVTADLHCAVSVDAKVETGGVADRLAAAAAPSRDRQPILVLGRRGAGERRGVPGSTAYRVLTLAKVPVLMHIE